MGDHMLSVSYDNGFWNVSVTCPDEAMGMARPCAVWANEDGSERENVCTFQQYVDAEGTDVLDGTMDFDPVPIVQGHSRGDDFYIEFA